jgi:hypothetical protein
MKRFFRKWNTHRLGSTLVVLLILLAPGCVPSLNPLYTEQDLIFDDRLLGDWAEDGDTADHWRFERLDERLYRVTCTEGGKEGRFDVRLMDLDGRRYLDFEPSEESLDPVGLGGFYRMHWVRAHTFAELGLVDGVLRMAMVNGDWLSKHLEQNPGSLAHRRRGSDELLLTASTEQLQRFVKTHAGEMFGDAMELKRVRGGSFEVTR